MRVAAGRETVKAEVHRAAAAAVVAAAVVGGTGSCAEGRLQDERVRPGQVRHWDWGGSASPCTGEKRENAR